MVQVKQKSVFGVETSHPNSFLDGTAFCGTARGESQFFLRMWYSGAAARNSQFDFENVVFCVTGGAAKYLTAAHANIDTALDTALLVQFTRYI